MRKGKLTGWEKYLRWAISLEPKEASSMSLLMSQGGLTGWVARVDC